ncbi:MAG TPA: hypothetical protein VM532_11760 [Burkholderiales bacterium]|nr:hypothetical protein [Burkholderiales bacterium]
MEKTKTNNVAQLSLPALNMSAISRLVIYHVDADISTPIPILPGELEYLDIAKRIETKNPHDFVAAHKALCESKAFPDPEGSIDARWSVHFIDKSDNVFLSIDVDRFGVQGVIDRVLVYFSSSEFHRWLEARYAK